MEKIRFNELQITDKAYLVAEFGNWLMSAEYYDYRVQLYVIDGHFVEVYYNIFTRQVERISLAEYSDFDKYLCNIVLPSIRFTH